jgi:hypothetical protein
MEAEMKLNLPRFLFINGPPGSGKTTLSRMICETNSEATTESFASPIREMIWSVFFPEHVVSRPFDLKDTEIKKRELVALAKIEPTDPGSQTTVREAMIEFSENYMKKLFGEDIFGRLLWNRCYEETQFYSSFVIDDSGFVPEAAYVVSRADASVCRLIRLHRSGCNYSADSRSYITLPGVQTLDLHNDGAPDEMMQTLQLELGNI